MRSSVEVPLLLCLCLWHHNSELNQSQNWPSYCHCVVWILFLSCVSLGSHNSSHLKGHIPRNDKCFTANLVNWALVVCAVNSYHLMDFLSFRDAYYHSWISYAVLLDIRKLHMSHGLITNNVWLQLPFANLHLCFGLFYLVKNHSWCHFYCRYKKR